MPINEEDAAMMELAGVIAQALFNRGSSLSEGEGRAFVLGAANILDVLSKEVIPKIADGR